MDKKALAIGCLMELGAVFVLYLLCVPPILSPEDAARMVWRGHGLWFVLVPLLTAAVGGQRIAAGRDDQVPAVFAATAAAGFAAFVWLYAVHLPYEGNI
jgi:hypothetical protein